MHYSISRPRFLALSAALAAVLLGLRAAPAQAKDDLLEVLAQKGVILRGVGAYGLPNCLRLTIGTEEANRAAVAGLAAFAKS